MQVLVLGVGNAFTKLHFGASALIEFADAAGATPRRVLLDCPDPIHRVIHEAASAVGWDVGVPDIDDIILTHIHGDHSNGLESFAFSRRYHRRGHEDEPTPRLHTIAPVADRLWEKLAPAMDGPMRLSRPARLSDYFDLHILEPGQTSDIAGLRIECRVTGHSVPTIGLKVTGPSWTLGWSGDTPFEEEHVRWLSGADIIVHETSPGPVHTPIESLNALPDELRAKMRLIHMPDDFDPTSTDIRLLRQGEILTL